MNLVGNKGHTKGMQLNPFKVTSFHQLTKNTRWEISDNADCFRHRLVFSDIANLQHIVGEWAQSRDAAVLKTEKGDLVFWLDDQAPYGLQSLTLYTMKRVVEHRI